MTLASAGIAVDKLTVHCEKCGHEWALGWLPMPADSVAVLLKHARCPSGHSRKFLRTGPAPRETVGGDPIAWLGSGDTGTSSETIWSVMMGRRPPRSYWHPSVPWDPDDFGRCYRLLNVIPSWRGRLSEVAAKFPEWGPLVREWETLTALYEEELPRGRAPKLYKRMKELIAEGEHATRDGEGRSR